MSELLHLPRLLSFVGGFASNLIGGRVAEGDVDADADINAYADDNLMLKLMAPYQARAQSARAFTGRRNSHSGRGEDFLRGKPIFFTETAVTPDQKVEKSFPRWEINRHDKD